MIIFLTGSTGLLGGEILVNLSKRKEIEKIYCLIRANDQSVAIDRLVSVFNFHNDQFDPEKIIAIQGDLYDEQLTEKLLKNEELESVETIIHTAANTSFSRIYDDLVEKTNIGGLTKICEWAKELKNLQSFCYIGTATICGKDKKDRTIYEDESPDLNAVHLVKYTYTKMQGELILEKYFPEEKLFIARPSIIMGDSRALTPRSPVILWALATMNALRLCTINANSKMDIISVDYASEAIVRLLFVKRKHKVYHISSGEISATTPLELSNAIAAFFTDRPLYKFIHKSFLDEMKRWAKKTSVIQEELNEYNEYLSYWEKIFEDKSKLRIIFAGLEPYIEFVEMGHLFDNKRLMDETGIEAPTPAHIYIKNSIEYLKKINILEGAIDP